MKKISLLLAVWLYSSWLMAQTLAPQVVASGGAYASSSAGSISYTVGEPITPTLSDGGQIITQGFQQPSDIISGLLDMDRYADGSFSVYPIPATDKLWYGYEFSEQGKVTIEMHDILGQRIDYGLTEAYASGKVIHSFDCSSFAVGQYVLSISFSVGAAAPRVLSKQFLIIH